MTIEDAQATLNHLAAEAAKDSPRFKTMEEIQEFLKNPPKRPRSIPMEEAMAAIVDAFRQAGGIVLQLNEHARKKFLGYAARMAVEAVRQNQPDLIEQGLVALAIENGAQDWRDSIVVLFQLDHSARKLGIDSASMFAKIALLAQPGRIQKEMQNFPNRPPEQRSLKAFCMEEEITEEGFRYKQIPWRKLAQIADDISSLQPEAPAKPPTAGAMSPRFTAK